MRLFLLEIWPFFDFCLEIFLLYIIILNYIDSLFIKTPDSENNNSIKVKISNMKTPLIFRSFIRSLARSSPLSILLSWRNSRSLSILLSWRNSRSLPHAASDSPPLFQY